MYGGRELLKKPGVLGIQYLTFPTTIPEEEAYMGLADVHQYHPSADAFNQSDLVMMVVTLTIKRILAIRHCSQYNGTCLH